MLHDFTVRIIVKNKTADNYHEKVCSFPFYCQEQKRNLTKIIAEIEKAFSALQSNKPKEEWDTDTALAFNKIRHNILDAANSVERLPKTLHYKDVPVDSIPSGKYIAEFFNSVASPEGDVNVYTI